MSPAAVQRAIDAGADLSTLRGLLLELAAVLDEERAAVARLDTAALIAANDHKQELARTIQQLGDRARDRATDRRLPDSHARDEVRAMAIRVRASALANGALLADAVRAANEALGLGDEATTYDRRAQRVTTRGGHGIVSL